MIKAIAFDYGGVIEITEKGLIQKIADYLQITTEDWEKEYMTLNYLCNTGQKSYKEVYGLVARKFNAGETQVSHIKEMMDENQATRKMNLELIEIIKDLKDKNYKVGLSEQ